MGDGAAYVDADTWAQILSNVGLTRDQVTARYDCVIHLVTAAVGAPGAYTVENNAARMETAEAGARPSTNEPISVYRFPRRALTLCPQLCMGIQPGYLAPDFPRGALKSCPQLCMGISPRRYTDIGLLRSSSPVSTCALLSRP